MYSSAALVSEGCWIGLGLYCLKDHAVCLSWHARFLFVMAENRSLTIEDGYVSYETWR